ncbi:MAG: phosphoribosylglycinamide formyltransferase [Gemmatimonadota bacterium]|nr:phosphoribosylglycinamide formyltransferase [Gemmatimonadota bacterium]MDE3012689.1 phosphoribosylglycinamide formyltransferase [Gemmatimonadota bacterium]
MTSEVGSLNVALLASGGGSNLQALLDHSTSADRGWTVRLVVVNREAGAADRARAVGIPVRIISTKGRTDQEISRETLAAFDEHGIDVVLLAGYLRRIPPEVTRRFAGRILNIHPALLPEFGGRGMYGMNVHRAVAESDVAVTGATVHFVNEAYDEGSVLAQWQIARHPGDTPADIAARVLEVEHRLYPAAVDHLCSALRADIIPGRMADIRLDEPPDVDRTENSPPLESNEEVR